jgi:hypothetical protein
MPAVGVIAIAVIAAVAGTGHWRTHIAKARNPVAAETAHSSAPSANQRARVRAHLDALPLAFEANQGRLDPQVKYMARGNGYKLLLTNSRAIITVAASRGNSEVREMMFHKRLGAARTRAALKKRNLAVKKSSSVALNMNFLGANHDAQLVAHDQQSGRVNYFTGKDPRNWHTNIPLFGRVQYRGLYRGVDLDFLGEARQIEFNYIVHPGADPSQIALGLDGAKALAVTSDGNLAITMPVGSLQLHKPVAYQQDHGLRRAVDVRFVADRDNRITFALGGYDRNRDLVIDPTVSYSTYFGGDASDQAAGIAVDGSGNSFIAGSTDSTTIPGNSSGAIGFDVFVTEIGPTGTLIFSDIIGGSQDDFPGGITIDSQGIYLAGTTDSSDFPVSGTAVQNAFMGGTSSGNNDAFALKLALNGSAITWGTFVAGSESDSGLGIAVDSGHNVYVVGETFSTNLGGSIGGVNPLPNGNALNLGANNLNDDGYVVKINSSGTAYSLVSYLGGSNGDLATGVALDGSGNIFVVGDTISTDLPFTLGAVQTQCGTDGTCDAGSAGPQDDVFVVSIKPTLLAYNYFTYYGGSGVDDAIAVTANSGNAFFTGATSSSDFLTAGTPFQSSLFGSQNAFLVELNSAGSSASYSTYLGGQGPDIGLAVALDGSQNVYVTGQASSPDFPIVNPFQASLSGTTDAFVSVFGLSQNQVLFSTYLGGGGDEDQFEAGIGVDSLDYIFVTGDTDSGNGSTEAFPTTTGAIDASYGGGSCVDSIGNTVPCPDAFVTSFTPATAPDFTVSASALSPASVAPGSSATSTVTVTPLNGYTGTVDLTCSVTGSGSPSPQCSLNPTTGNSSTMTVTTTGTAMASRQSGGLIYALWLPIVGLSFAGLRLTTSGSTKGKFLSFLLFGAVMTLLFLLPACGGGGGGGGGGGCSGCTPAGSYTVTVTGTDSTDSTLSHDAAVTLTVN